METLGHCVVDQKDIMNEVKGTVQLRRVEESKFSSKMGSMELEMLRVCTYTYRQQAYDVDNYLSGSVSLLGLYSTA